jgi:O-methyltransferase domain
MRNRSGLARKAQIAEFAGPLHQRQLSPADISTAIARAYDFSDADCVVDVGGGAGHLMSALLQAHTHLHGVVLERVPTLALAWREMKHAGLAQRCECTPGNFFDAVPGGGDIYILKNVLCDWNDSASVAILRRCRSAMAPHAKLLIAERLLNFAPGDGNQSETSFDIHVSIAAGEHLRTGREYLALLNEAGFGPTRTFATASPLSLIEANR